MIFFLAGCGGKDWLSGVPDIECSAMKFQGMISQIDIKNARKENGKFVVDEATVVVHYGPFWYSVYIKDYKRTIKDD